SAAMKSENNPPSIASTIETAASEAERPATTGAVRASDARFSIVPLGGYNQTRGSFGGLKFSTIVPSRLLNRLQSQFTASNNSKSGHLDLYGSKSTEY